MLTHANRRTKAQSGMFACPHAIYPNILLPRSCYASHSVSFELCTIFAVFRCMECIQAKLRLIISESVFCLILRTHVSSSIISSVSSYCVHVYRMFAWCVSFMCDARTMQVHCQVFDVSFRTANGEENGFTCTCTAGFITQPG